MITGALISGLIIGSVSSLHCVGMCGPMALAFGTTPGRIALYHGGRILTYTLLGLIAGLIGRRMYIGGFQQIVSIALGVLIIAGLILTRRRGNALLSKPIFWLQSRAVRRSHSFTVGMANGLLPCGMVYIALAAALGTGNLAAGITLMTAFGLGTLPPLLILHWSRNFLSLSTRIRLRRATPYFIAAMGLLLILRGCNLGIPFLSPSIPSSPGSAISCH